MSLIFSPLTEDALEGPYEPLPRSTFLMLHLGEGVSKVEQEMENVVSAILHRNKFKPIKATSKSGQKDFLEKIIQIIRGCGFGTAIFSEYTPAATLANIFFEIALCNLLGKPVVIVKTKQAQAPSDFVRTEWVSYTAGEGAQLKKEFTESVNAIGKLADYYQRLGEIAMAAEEIDLELAYERYKQSLLITNRPSVRRKIEGILSRLSNPDDPSSVLTPARKRFRTSVTQFCNLLP